MATLKPSRFDKALPLLWVLLVGSALALTHWYDAVLRLYVAFLLWQANSRYAECRAEFHKGIVVGQRSVMTARGRWPTPDEAAKKARP